MKILYWHIHCTILLNIIRFLFKKEVKEHKKNPIVRTALWAGVGVSLSPVNSKESRKKPHKTFAPNEPRSTTI